MTWRIQSYEHTTPDFDNYLVYRCAGSSKWRALFSGLRVGPTDLGEHDSEAEAMAACNAHERRKAA